MVDTAGTKRLLVCGVVAGAIYVAVGLAQILTREGFDMTRHPLSMLSLGEMGWVQTSSFIVTGVLVLLGGIGLRRVPGADPRWRRGALFIGLFGVCVIGGGLFTTDPSLGFPPGARDGYPETLSWHALLHFIFGQLGFLALIVATFVLARSFGAAGLRGWAAYSALAGGVLVAAIVVSVGFAGAGWAMVALYVAVGFAWVWISALNARSLRTLAEVGLPAPSRG